MGLGLAQALKEEWDDFRTAWNAVEVEERAEARKFAEKLGREYLNNDKYDKEFIVGAINRVMSNLAKKSRKLARYIVEALRSLFPEEHARYHFRDV